MINKKNLPAIIICSLIIFFGFVKINIINTKALSPIGNAENNYEKIINEFGEEFEEFIKDNSYIKIYENKGSEERAMVKLGETELFIKETNIVIEKVKEYYTYFITGYEVVKSNLENKINSKDNEVIEENEDVINVNSEINKEKIDNLDNIQNKLDKIVEDFMKNKE